MNISLAPDILFQIGSFAVTNSFLWSVVLSLSLIAFSLLIVRRLKSVPGRWQGGMEVLLEGAYGFVRSVIGNDSKARKVFPLVFTMFIFTLAANLATFIPGQSAIELHRAEGVVPLFRAVMADYSLVFVMTIVAIVTTQVVAIAAAGPWGYAGKFINLSGFKAVFANGAGLKQRLAALAQAGLDFFLGLMDIVGETAKIISLSFRLFGNMFAGEVLGAVMLFLAPFFVPLPFLFLGLLTALVQAFVFSVLTLIFITMASEGGEAA